MGLPMLRALRGAGFDALGFDVRAPGDFAGDADAMSFAPGDFARDLTCLFTVVRDAAETDALLFDDQEMIDRAGDLQVLIICSTLSPRYLQQIRARVPEHIAMIDAPMSGAQVAARERQLSFMLGGHPAGLDALTPLFHAMGPHLHRMGGFGAGMQAKVLNNLLAAASIATTRLVLDWADQAGLDERAFLDLVNTSSGQNWLASGFDRIEFARDGYSPDNSIGILAKDVECVISAAPEGADLAIPSALLEALRKLEPRG